jgi:hypothetical protein
MSKGKVVPRKLTTIRLPKSMHDRLLKISADRSIKAGKSVSVGTLIVEAVEKILAVA